MRAFDDADAENVSGALAAVTENRARARLQQSTENATREPPNRYTYRIRVYSPDCD